MAPRQHFSGYEWRGLGSSRMISATCTRPRHCDLPAPARPPGTSARLSLPPLPQAPHPCPTPECTHPCDLTPGVFGLKL